MSTAFTLNNIDDIIDVRDVIERFEELDILTAMDNKDAKEHALLFDLLDDLKGNGGDEQWRGDWYPSTLIRDTYFNEAMDEMLEDIGDLPKNLPSYLTICIDYKALQMDYSCTEINGVTYWYR